MSSVFSASSSICSTIQVHTYEYTVQTSYIVLLLKNSYTRIAFTSYSVLFELQNIIYTKSSMGAFNFLNFVRLHFLVFLHSTCNAKCYSISLQQVSQPESMELFIKDQAFLPSPDSAPRPPSPPPLSRQQLVSLSQSSYVSPVERQGERGGGGGRGSKSYDSEKAWPSINPSIQSNHRIKNNFYKYLFRCFFLLGCKEYSSPISHGGISHSQD